MAGVADTLLATLQQFTGKLDASSWSDGIRKQLHDLAKNIMYQTESPRQTRDRLFYSGFSADIAQVAVDLKIFKILATDPEKAWSVKDLGEACNADPPMLHRLLRFLAAEGYVTEKSSGVFQASHQTVNLANDGTEYGLNHNRIDTSPAANALPEFLKDTAYTNPIDHSKTAFHKANGKSIFDVMTTSPERAAVVGQFMTAQRDGITSWMTNPEYLKDLILPTTETSSSRPVFIDVGGGVGHQCLALAKHLPSTVSISPKQIILQDTQPMISQISSPETQPFTPLVHDFFTPQPQSTTGAKVYYMRNVLHDWPDKQCREILKQLVDAMAEDSLIMIDESIVPEKGADLHVCARDIVMMVCCAAFERTETEWRDLVDGVGLKVRDVWAYEKETGDGLIVCKKKSAA